MAHSLHLPDDAAEACTLWYIRRRLGRDDYSGARMLRYVAMLQSDHGFPPCYPGYRRKGGIDHLITEPVESSRWPRDAVDQWFSDFLPDPNAAALDRTAMRAAAHDMDAAAGNLRLIRGGLKTAKARDVA